MEVHELRVLEEKIEALLGYCRVLEAERAKLEERLQEQESRLEAVQGRLNEMMQERESVKSRVSSLISKIDQLGSLIGGEPGEPGEEALPQL